MADDHAHSSPTQCVSPPVSLLYVKRKRTEPPSNSSLFVQLSAKRQKTLVTEFKFVASTRDEPVKLDRDELLRKYRHGNTVTEIKDRCRKEADNARRSRKFNVISAAREANGAVFSATLADEDEIVCNAEKMFSQKLTISDDCPAPFLSNGTEEWVYDVYVCDNPCDGEVDDIRLELDDFEPITRERYINEYDEDSNDENYWANDYPDEETSSSENSEDSEDYGVVRNKRYSNEFYDTELGIGKGGHYLDRYLVSDTDSD